MDIFSMMYWGKLQCMRTPQWKLYKKHLSSLTAVRQQLCIYFFVLDKIILNDNNSVTKKTKVCHWLFYRFYRINECMHLSPIELSNTRNFSINFNLWQLQLVFQSTRVAKGKLQACVVNIQSYPINLHYRFRTEKSFKSIFSPICHVNLERSNYTRDWIRILF